MAISVATVGSKITTAFINLIVGRVNRMGLTSIIPTSIAGTGVALSASGAVTFVSATTVSVNVCFTAEFDNYLIKYKGTGRSVASDIRIKLRAAGADNSAAAYSTQIATANGTTVTAASVLGNTNGWVADAGQGAFGTIDISLASPALSEQTLGKIEFTNSGASVFAGSIGLFHNVASPFDGFTLFPSVAANLTGTLRIYGYNN